MSFNNDLHSLSHTKWICKFHIVFAPKYRRKVFSMRKEKLYAKRKTTSYASGKNMSQTDFSKITSKIVPPVGLSLLE